MKTTRILLLGCALALTATSLTARAQILNPQQISGTVRFSNANAVILNLLTNSSSLILTTAMRVFADAQPPASLTETTYTTNGDALSFSYQMTVDTGTGSGIAYKLTPNWYAIPTAAPNSVENTYVFASQTTPLLTSPGSPATLDFSECAGILDVHFV